MSEKEVLIIKGQGDGLDGWSPDIVVGVDFGMTCTGMLSPYFDLLSAKLTIFILIQGLLIPLRRNGFLPRPSNDGQESFLGSSQTKCQLA